MNVVITIDSFKGSMTSLEAGESASAGIRRIYPDADITIRPLADGGEGTVDALTLGCGGTCTQVCVTGPLEKPVLCSYGILDAGKTAVIEMSGAAGITLLSETERNPLYTTTYGVGEVIRDAISRGCRHFIIGIGGSATNDGGIGMLQALGFDLLDQEGVPVRHGALGLKDLAVISDSHALPELKECTFRIACDVTNPLCGSQGCSAVFGPQKGADPAMIQQMDQWLSSYAALAGKSFPKTNPAHAGAGAAGGLGFAMMAFLNAVPNPGADLVIDAVGLNEKSSDCDLAITGEGSIDFQTAFGKTPMAVTECVKKNSPNCTIVGLCGHLGKNVDVLYEKGFDALFPIVSGPQSLEEAMENGELNLTRTAENVLRLIKRTKFSI